jgi:hypothetical protein
MPKETGGMALDLGSLLVFGDRLLRDVDRVSIVVHEAVEQSIVGAVQLESFNTFLPSSCDAMESIEASLHATASRYRLAMVPRRLGVDG